MRYVSLPCGMPSVSVLGLGCAAMMGSASRRDSLAALTAATDSGINFFDTARSYGYGASETLLGEFFQANSHRSQVILCTKFGILPAASNWKLRLKPLARTTLKLFPSLRRVARIQTGQLAAANHFSVASLRSSLETSLRELRTDYIDILLLHAAPMHVLAQDDLFEELARLVSEGKVRLAGISAEHDVIAAAFAQRPAVLQTAQFAVNLSTLAFLDEPQPSGLFLVANQPFGGRFGVIETRRQIAGLSTNPTIAPELRAKLNPADPQLVPELILNLILTGMGIDAVVPAMLKPSHLRSNCRAIEQCRFTPAELARLRLILKGALRQAPSPTDPPAATSAPSA